MKHFLLSVLIIFSGFLLNAKDYHDLPLSNNENNTSYIGRIGNADLTVKMPDFIFENTNTKIELQFVNPNNVKLNANNYVLNFILNGQEIPVEFDQKGTAVIHHKFSSGENINLLLEDFSFQKEINIISLWMILAPIGFILLLITLRFLNVRARKKADENIKKSQTTRAVEIKKEMNPEKKEKVQEEEEMLV